MRKDKLEDVLLTILGMYQSSQGNAVYGYCLEELNKLGVEYKPRGHRTYG